MLIGVLGFCSGPSSAQEANRCFGEFEAFLSILTFVPAIGALVIALFRFTARPEDQALIDRNSRLVAGWRPW